MLGRMGERFTNNQFLRMGVEGERGGEGGGGGGEGGGLLESHIHTSGIRIRYYSSAL
jgi:hypothetical protein